nr:midasin-like [Lytechinus pictus]
MDQGSSEVTTFDPDLHSAQKNDGHELLLKDYHDNVVSVCGVLLPRTNVQDTAKTSLPKLVQVQTTKKNLQSLALAVSAGNGVLLEGPVGCGKTALVEHLAAQTGRTVPPSIIKVQLGDQTDSKALLGTYRCTDIPGEFVWQAGALTQAVTHGHWILLEDIDYAPMDVISVLLPLLESRSLCIPGLSSAVTHGHWILLEDIDYAPMDVISVLLPLLESRSLCIPGHGNVVKAAPGFQLFATQRLLSTSAGLHRQHVSHGAMLDQLWTRVRVEPMSRDELHQVITTLYPKLTTVANRLLDIFCTLTAGHQTWLDTPAEFESSPGDGEGGSRTAGGKIELGSHDRRLVSTRDLIKWCERIERDFQINSSQSANMVFLEALDCFCAALTNPKTRLAVAEQIGARLNITKEKARFYCSTYKPNIEEGDSTITSGRAILQQKERDTLKMTAISQFAFTRPAAVLVERVACCIVQNEPVLLVGETGTGKTSTIQYLSSLVGQRLKVINMNQQSDSTDLLGGFKPVDLRQVVAPVREAFEGAFRSTFSVKQNTKFLSHIQKCFTQRQWRELVQLMIHSQQAALKRFGKAEGKNGDGANKKDIGGQWRSLGERLHQLQLQIQHSENTLAFSFVEGTLVKALRNGDWILLDEINLATAETLECLSCLLESTEGSVVLMERGDTKPIIRHKDFRLFACMNPATDVGKKELPPGLRNRFTELFVDELEEVPDLKILTKSYLRLLSITEAQVEGIVQFYLSVRKEAIQKLTDGTGHRPHYSLRTLCRALKLASTNHCDSVPRSLYESFCLSFLTQLDRASHPIVEKLVCKHVIGKSNLKSLLGQSIPPPAGGNKYMKLEGYWVAVGEKEGYKPKDYVITPSVKANLRDLARIVSAGRFPVLIQGETSVGKTSLVNYLAQLTGNHCVRVNNHEHTDLQEYVGFYAADESGKLVFKEGVLVDAMRKGHWIILDELNLAPSDVLEALNRLLDDNRELFIPETQEVVAAHPKFMLFATQNPPGQYGGRKVLSRAFRNRFVELHFDEIPSRELETILHDRCQIPVSYCRKMVATMLELQMRRKGSGVFAGKQGFITLRDLFRWAERYRHASQGDQAFYDWNQHIADEGYILLAGRVRREEEAETIREVLEKNIKRVVNPQHLFTLSEHTSPVTRNILEKVTSATSLPGFHHIVWTYGMRRLAVLVGQALKFGEPVLLVGETGCGKTTICQLFAALASQKLHAVNCHLHTETSDFLGGLRPVRHHSDETDEESKKLFEWCDGPLILAMREGAVFLIDEISLADDSVLGCLNSVLEPERTLLLAEKGSGEECGDDIAVIKAEESFRVVSTMNPGGDFGKKELSPALRNRFTEIWCPQNTQRTDLVSIIEHNLCDGVQLCNQEDGSSGIGNAVMDFVEWFANNEVGKKCTVSIRDILSWVNFINVCCDPSHHDPMTSPDDLSPLDPAVAYIHGACMVFVDGLGSGTTSNSLVPPTQARHTCIRWLSYQIKQLTDQEIDLSSLLVTSDLSDLKEVKGHGGGIVCEGNKFGIRPFFIKRGPSPRSPVGYALDAPTTALNAQRILRALQLPRAILLEGSPGVGKTSLVSALAKASGHELVRINLSEQTDITDLFGADLPVEGGEGGQFAWRDGPLLQALRAGHWVVLDELNLASQSVLEGLNACLDHRAEVFVPELGRSFQIQHEKTRIFACQNPLKQGGGRKGLPKSFLNRFTQVYIEPFTSGDLLFIVSSVYPMIDRDILLKMVEFSNRLYRKTMIEGRWGQRGGPWEFNLRDLFRWCDLMVHDQGVEGQIGVKVQMDPGQHVGLVYGDRMRTADDKEKIYKLYHVVFRTKGEELPSEAYRSSRQFHITHSHVQVGHSFLARDPACDVNSALSRSPLQLLHHDLDTLESIMKCVEMNWMSILVGPSSSGKTSLVHLLASLTGHRLQVLAMNSAMDTTELLGGFEQADLIRHWESLLGMIYDVAMATIRNLLTSDASGTRLKAKRIMGILSTLKLPNEGREQDSLFPTEQKLNLLDQLLAQLEKCSETMQGGPELAIVIEAANALKSKCKLEDRSIPGGGGKFEWVDGLLVHALKNGDWLLIDNVNFCSPSVLDRLNALLEPGGVLTINERGVIDGQIPAITPHPQFRLFLSMDPRHGEISRAMRNRGVEIYMLGENEGGAYSDQDTRTLLHSLGLTSEGTITSLINIHQEMRSHLQGTDSARLPSLLLAASMVMQLSRNGAGMKRALWKACMEVYVNGQLLIGNKQRAREALERCLQGQSGSAADDADHDSPMEIEEHCLTDSHLANSEGLDDKDYEDDGDDDGDDEDDDDVEDHVIKAYPLTNAKNLSTNPMLVTIQREGAVLHHLLTEIQRSNRTTSTGVLLKTALLIVLEKASVEDCKLRCDWLKSLGACPGSVLDVGSLAEGVLHSLMNHPITEQIEKEMKELCSGHHMEDFLINSPLDVHWNEQLLKLFNVHLQRAASALEESMEDDGPNRMDIIQSLARRLFVFLRRALSESCLAHQTNQEPKSKKKRKPSTVLQLSQAFEKGRLSSEALPHQSVAHVGPFFQAWDQFFSERLAFDGPLQEDQAFQILVACGWRDRLWQLCTQPITDGDRFSFGQLALHWDWFLKETVQVVKSTLNESSSLPAALHTIMKCLHASLTQTDTTSTMTLDLGQWEGLCRLLGQPLPFQTGHIAETSQRISRLCQSLNVIRQVRGKLIGRQRDADRCIAFMSSSRGPFTCRLLEDSLMKVLVLQDQSEFADEAVGPIEYNLIREGLLPPNPTLYPEDPDSTPDERNGTVQDAHEMTVWLWPIKEHMALTTSQQVVAELMSESFKQEGLQSNNKDQLREVESLYEFIRFQVPFHPYLLYPLNSVLLHPHSKIGSVQGHTGVIAEVAAAHLNHMQSNTVVASMERWLSWKPCVGDDEEMQTCAMEDGSSVTGPSNLYTPVQTRCMFRLLSDQHNHSQPSSTTPRAERKQRDGVQQVQEGGKSVPLASWEAHQSHLQEILQVLWRNSGWMSSRGHDFMASGVSYLVTSAAWLLRAFSSLLPDEGDKTRWLTACSNLVSMATTTTSPPPSPGIQSPIESLGEILKCNSGRSQTDSEALPLVRDERDGALRVIDNVGSLLEILLQDLGMLLSRWMGRDADTLMPDTFAMDLNALGTCWIHLGHLQAVLLAPQGPVDPAEHHAIRLRYVMEEILELEAELKVRGMSSRFLTGKSLFEFSHQEVHPRIHALIERLAALKEMEAELSKRNAFRPHPPQFDDITKDVRVYLTTSGSSQTIKDLLQKHKDILHKPDEDTAMLRDRLAAWQASQDHFMDRIRGEYPSYRDLWSGMLTGVAGLSYGMQLVAHSVQCQHHRQHLQLAVSPRQQEQITSAEELVVSIAGFSSVQPEFSNWLSVAERLTTVNVHSLLQKIWSRWSGGRAKQEQLMHSILKLALYHTTNHTTLHGQLTPVTLDLLHGIMGSFVSHYHRAEEAARQREEEEASLYKYKSRSHGDGMTDEQMEEKELRESFPSFEKEFADITAEPSLDDQPKPEDDTATSDPDSTSTRQLDTPTMRLLRDTHGQMFTGMVNVPWMRSGGQGSNSDVDVKDVAQLGYATAVELAHEVLPYLAPRLDKHLIGAHLVRVHDLQVAIATEQSDEKSKPIRKADDASKPYDIYHDPNIPETIRCKPVLDDFMERIKGLLAEWPEHPTLKQLTMLIERIQSFSVDSPLMKFVTGLELLLSKSQEWESNASKAVSIQTHLEEITQTIIRWRKLELNCWVAMLDNVTFTQAEGSLKWWFHVYRLIQTYIAKSQADIHTQNPSSGTEDENPTQKPISGAEVEIGGHDEGEEEDGTTIRGIVGILQKLIEGASLGEFAARLEMLRAFHSQVVASMHSTEETSELSCILWNMYCYYRQFLTAVSMEIENKRKPIEKELKDFVKIAKWNDISFWAMKQAVEKTHKTLIKFKKKYEVCLQGPAKAVFADEKIEQNKQKDETRAKDIVWKDEWKIIFDDSKYQEYFPPSLPTTPQDGGLIARIPVLFERMRKHCSSLWTKRNYSVMSETLDEFVGEIITTLRELQALEVTKDAEPEKQKSEIRHIHQRKRKALSELFKYLTSIGLSYKKGLLRLNQTEKNQPESFLFLPPVDLQATFKSCDTSPDQWPVSTSHMSEIWLGCHEYFFRCQARRAALRDAVANPSKELGVGNVERVKGFTEHLSELIIDQRGDVATMATGISQLRNILKEMEHLPKNSPSVKPENACHLPPQEQSASWIARSKVTIDQSLQAILQFTTILDCCPERDKIDGDSKTMILSPVPEESLTKADHCFKGDQVWLEIKTNIKACQDSLERLKADLDPVAHHIDLAKMKQSVTLIPWESMDILKQCHTGFIVVADRLGKVVEAFTLPETGEQTQLVQSLVFIAQSIRSWSAEFETWYHSLGERSPLTSEVGSINLVKKQ